MSRSLHTGRNRQTREVSKGQTRVSTKWKKGTKRLCCVR